MNWDCFLKKKNLKKAAHAYQQSLTLQPNSFQTLNRLTMLYIKKKNYTDAIVLLSGPMLKLQHDNADIYYNISCLFAIQNDQEKAIEWLCRALEKRYDGWGNIKTDPDLENIRNSSCYQEIIKTIKQNELIGNERDNKKTRLSILYFCGRHHLICNNCRFWLD